MTQTDSSQTSSETSAVRYERDTDGIVTLVLDDPTSSANTMNQLYSDSMAAAVDRLGPAAVVLWAQARSTAGPTSWK